MSWEHEYWQFLDRLVAEKDLVIDRPRGSAHPRYPQMVYPLDYGFLDDTHSVDGAAVKHKARSAIWDPCPVHP